MLVLLYELVEGRHYRDSQKGRFSCSFLCSRQMPRCLKTMNVVASEVLTRLHTSCTIGRRRPNGAWPLPGPNAATSFTWPSFGHAGGAGRTSSCPFNVTGRGDWHSAPFRSASIPGPGVSALGESLLGVLPQHGAQTGLCSPRSESSEH